MTAPVPVHCFSITYFKWCKRFEEGVDLILDDTGRGLKLNVTCTEKTLTVISDPLDEDRLYVLTLLHSVIRNSIRTCTNDEYIGKSNPLLFGVYFERK